MKRLIALFLSLALILPLTACDSSGLTQEETPSTTEPTTAETVKPLETTEPTEAMTEPEVATIEEAVILDEAGVKITAKSLEFGERRGPKINLLIENNSGTALTVQCRNASVNGYMVDTMMSADVADGKKANDSLTIYQSSLDECGITEIADIEFSFHIFNSDTWDAYLDTNLIQLETSAAANHVYSFDDSGEVLCEEDGVKIVSKGVFEDDEDGKSGALVYVQNDSGENITVQVRDVSVNGFMIDAVFSTEVVNGKRALNKIEFKQSELENNDIASVEVIELYFHVFNTEDWGEDFDTDIVKIEK